jgi:hypothetical protein
VARSLTPKSSVTWRLKPKPKQNPAWKTPDAFAPTLVDSDGGQGFPPCGESLRCASRFSFTLRRVR